MDMNEFISTIKQINAYKMSVDDYLDILLIWYRDILMFKAMNEVDSLVFKDEIKSIRERANQSSYEGIQNNRIL